MKNLTVFLARSLEFETCLRFRYNLKNAVTKFDTDEFISNRSIIQRDLYYGVRQRLSGKCCLPNCKKSKQKFTFSSCELDCWSMAAKWPIDLGNK
jgi:hypothetical protein